jgi:hypothetical protein
VRATYCRKEPRYVLVTRIEQTAYGGSYRLLGKLTAKQVVDDDRALVWTKFVRVEGYSLGIDIDLTAASLLSAVDVLPGLGLWKEQRRRLQMKSASTLPNDQFLRTSNGQDQSHLVHVDRNGISSSERFLLQGQS